MMSVMKVTAQNMQIRYKTKLTATSLVHVKIFPIFSFQLRTLQIIMYLTSLYDSLCSLGMFPAVVVVVVVAVIVVVVVVVIVSHFEFH